jgi:hypothetical protein
MQDNNIKMFLAECSRDSTLMEQLIADPQSLAVKFEFDAGDVEALEAASALVPDGYPVTFSTGMTITARAPKA